MNLYGFMRPSMTEWANPRWYDASTLKEWLITQHRRDVSLPDTFPSSPSDSPPVSDHKDSDKDSTPALDVMEDTKDDVQPQVSGESTHDADTKTATLAAELYLSDTDSSESSSSDKTISVTVSDPGSTTGLPVSEHVRDLLRAKLLSKSPSEPGLSKGPPFDPAKDGPGCASDPEHDF